MRRDRTHHEHLAGIAVVTILDDSDVDIDNVPRLQFFLAGDSVTDLMVDGSTNRFRKATVIERCGYRILFLDDVVMTGVVKFLRGDPGYNVFSDHVEDVCCQVSGDSHQFNLFC